MKFHLCSLTLDSPEEQVISPVLVHDGTVCPSITSYLGKGGGDTENSFLPRTLFALFIFHSAKGALVGSLQLVHPKAFLSAFSKCNSPPRSQDL